MKLIAEKERKRKRSTQAEKNEWEREAFTKSGNEEALNITKIGSNNNWMHKHMYRMNNGPKIEFIDFIMNK